MVVSWWIEMWKSGDIPDQAVYLHVLEPQVNVEIQQRAEKNTSSASRSKTSGHRGISVAPHFLGSCFFTQKALWSGPPPEGLHKHILFPRAPLESLGWCWWRCHVDLLFSFAGVFSVWMVYCFWRLTWQPCRTCAVFICCQVEIKEPVPTVCHSRREPRDSCINSAMVFHRGRETFFFFSVLALQRRCGFRFVMSDKNSKPAGWVEK